MNEIANEQVMAAERYLEAKRTHAPTTLIYVYEKTYNYLLDKLRTAA